MKLETLVKLAKLRMKASHYRKLCHEADNAASAILSCSMEIREGRETILDVPLAIYLDHVDKPEPKLETFTGWEGQEPYARLAYPPFFIGRAGENKPVWIKASSDKFSIPTTDRVPTLAEVHNEAAANEVAA